MAAELTGRDQIDEESLAAYGELAIRKGLARAHCLGMNLLKEPKLQTLERGETISIPLTGNGEIQLAMAKGGQEAIEITMKFIGTTGEERNDQITVSPISGTGSSEISTATDNMLGLRYLAGMKPEKDVDQSRVNRFDPIQKWAIGLLSLGNMAK